MVILLLMEITLGTMETEGAVCEQHKGLQPQKSSSSKAAIVQMRNRGSKLKQRQ